ncbi:hypothetical protein Phi13:2_gp052 [Cellulophaga phage phi13:2]|uniref:Uncharacterized protein n=3 Tax=Pachyviridae TaxID=2946166 RepID=S0A5L1_9CAUD|nr:hypothetical protein Phi19:3_gp050 [Cellulophaga phage phi19:3]YP_008241094.1 hypothetical protein Phi46:3_gp051 [Cellulophaga phage phi46:3]YP_008242077.1 hypothetical protein Phi13:2_gp052 [Cellulophaga phage phi13:2]AGO47454.1 hypothetical protein Phi19:3_gp050 [Cellulophaga phage phi19:3]AGO48795.1 hypothetical protein Phi46:3_gp051 [Cellulophaga phage phi46:3]AGO49662.1 hypothetical protein Phi13:2_gp052 [Cellulophaga phage phi13:2]
MKTLNRVLENTNKVELLIKVLFLGVIAVTIGSLVIGLINGDLNTDYLK